MLTLSGRRKENIYKIPSIIQIVISLTLILVKKRRNWHRHDYSESDENISKVKYISLSICSSLRQVRSRA